VKNAVTVIQYIQAYMDCYPYMPHFLHTGTFPLNVLFLTCLFKKFFCRKHCSFCKLILGSSSSSHLDCIIFCKGVVCQGLKSVQVQESNSTGETVVVETVCRSKH